MPVSDVELTLETPGSDKQRVQSAGLLQRVQAGIAHVVEERAVGIEQAVEPIDQDPQGHQVEQRLVAARLAARRRGRLVQPLRPRGRNHRPAVRLPARAHPGRVAARGRHRSASDGGGDSMPVSFSSRADNCRASSLKALFSTGVSDGGFASPGARNGTTFTSASLDASAGISVGSSFGVSTAGSRSVWCEVSEDIGSGNSSGTGDVTLDSAGPSAAAGTSAAGSVKSCEALVPGALRRDRSGHRRPTAALAAR